MDLEDSTRCVYAGRNCSRRKAVINQARQGMISPEDYETQMDECYRFNGIRCDFHVAHEYKRIS